MRTPRRLRLRAGGPARTPCGPATSPLPAVIAVALVGLALPGAISAQAGPRVPLEGGLTLTYASSHTTGEPDYEDVVAVEKVEGDIAYLRVSWNRKDGRWRTMHRRLFRWERQNRHNFYNFGREGQNDRYPGSAYSMATGPVLAELKRSGRADVVILVPELSESTPYRGTLTRVGPGPEPFPVVLDGQRVTLRGVRAKGRLEAPLLPTLTMEYVFLDDPETPWYLDSRMANDKGQGGRKLLVRIGTSRAQSELADALRTRCEAHVNDIFFATASATVDSASAPTFQRIAAVLAANPGWRLAIVGHTDDIGDDSANLALSRRRAEAARAILVRDYHVAPARLTADGRGERDPLETNTTPQGRARNRRVDLKRNCK